MRMAGHSNFKTTQMYINLAKVVFADEMGLLGTWYGSSGTEKRYQVESWPAKTAEDAGSEANFA
jgi:hypothetical protein